MSAIDPLGLLDGDVLGERLPAHLYVHVPFCASKCAYCDFISYAGADAPLVDAVFRGIRSQLHGWSSTGLDGVLDSIYIGGGTPSVVAEQVVGLLGAIRRGFVPSVPLSPKPASRPKPAPTCAARSGTSSGAT